jgi:hypothetical protein
MRILDSQIRAALILAGLGAAAARPTAAEPVFEPVTYEITDRTVYDDTFTSPLAGSALLWVQNGDDGDSSVSSATVTLNGVNVVTASDFGGGGELFARKVDLLAGANSLSISLSGQPGAFVTLMILPRGERPDVTIGRLLVPYASTTNLVLDLKNGAHAGQRCFRVAFYDGSGHAVASSNRIVLPARGSLSQSVASLIVNGSWTAGSLEIFYAGRGAGRMFGQAATTDDISAISSIVEIQQAGARYLSPFDQAKKRN